MLMVSLQTSSDGKMSFPTNPTFSGNTGPVRINMGLCILHPEHPNVKLRRLSDGKMKQGHENIDSQNSLNHVKFVSNKLLLDLSYQEFIAAPPELPYYFNSAVCRRPSIFRTGNDIPLECVMVGHDSLIGSTWGFDSTRTRRITPVLRNVQSAIYWGPSSFSNGETTHRYKLVSLSWRGTTKGYMTPGTDWSLYLDGKVVSTYSGSTPPPVALPPLRKEVKFVNGKFQSVDIPVTPRSSDVDLGIDLTEDIANIGWTEIVVIEKTKRFRFESPISFIPSVTSSKKRYYDLLESLASYSVIECSKFSSGSLQSLYTMLNGVQFFNFMGIMFLHDSVGLIKDVLSFRKNPSKAIKSIKKTSLWKNWANTFLSIKYGIMTEADDINHVIKKLSAAPNTNNKYKSHGTAFDNNNVIPVPPADVSLSAFSNQYTSMMRYGDNTKSQQTFLSKVRKAGIMPDLSLLWEAIPFSFVADWFGNPGDIIQSVDSSLLVGAGSFNQQQTDEIWNNTISNQLSIHPTSIVLSCRTTCLAETYFGQLDLILYDRIVSSSMPRLEVAFDFSLHSGYLNHKAELSALLLQRMPR